MHRENWDDLRFLLAVAENGSVSAAARALGVNHATVLRRIAAFEARHGGEIFDRTPQGYAIPPERENLIEAAREVESAVYALERVIDGAQSPLSGVVRVTSTDTFCHGILAEIVANLPERLPAVRVELICANAHLDLSRLDADISVRPAAELPEGLAGSKGPRLGFAVYGEPSLPWLGMCGAISQSRPAKWLEQTVPETEFAATADSFLTLRAMVGAGMGKTVLPVVVAAGDRRLREVDVGLPEMSVNMWVACHPDMADVPRIRAVRLFLLEGLNRMERALSGS